jgi:hypothetical protein
MLEARNIKGELLASIPTSWQECTWKQYLDYQHPDYLERWGVSRVANESNLDLLKDALSFLSTPLTFEATNLEKFDFDMMPFGKYVSSLAYLEAYKNNIIEAFPYLVVIYKNDLDINFDKEASNLLCEKIYKTYDVALKLFEYISQKQQDIATWSNHFKREQTKIEKAGKWQEMSERWGYQMLIDSLAGGVGYLWEKSERMKTIDALTKIKMNIEQSYREYLMQKEMNPDAY